MILILKHVIFTHYRARNKSYTMKNLKRKRDSMYKGNTM